HEVEASSKKDQIMLQSARQAQMGEMISMIAHQWRQPLSSISTVTGNMLVFLELDNFEKNQFKELLNSINNHAQYLSRTINDFRNFFKPNKDKQSVQLESVLEQTINIIGKSLSYKNIKLQTDYQFETPLNTYPNELTQVFLNIIKNGQDVLLENQIEYPVIEIAGRNEGESQIVEISDNAGGIPLEIMDKIFEPYFSTKGEKTGTGLGLYMSKLIIEKHCKGTLEVENTDNGALFTIRLPLES
ncbi:MAG: HAMP domain-containing histidine kinase, partial [Deltaproteobacteria bacterium]|nr:HAMP domain-containing histidine kinase [Deltaproteobacteria bacterium]